MADLASSLRRAAASSALLLAFILPSAELRADVFSLWPFSQGSGGVSTGNGEIMNPKRLWTEPVLINGRDVSLGVSIVETPFSDCMRQLKAIYPKSSFAGNSSSLLMDVPLEGGRRLRLYLVSLGEASPSLQFTMEIPPGPARVPDWIPGLPMPPSSTPVTVMSFPKRGSSYGFFSSGLSPEQAISEMRKSMLASGWRQAGGDEAAGDSSSGETFIRDKPLEIAIVGASSMDDGSTRGSVYLRSIKGDK